MKEKDDIRKYIQSDRRDFGNDSLSAQDLHHDPVEQFARWMADAKAAAVTDPYAVCVSTIDAQGFPQSRMVYLRDIIDGGFVFYTNYESAKGNEVAEVNKASLNFHWQAQHRQIRIVGVISRVEEEVSDTYFASRPRESQLGAWASNQSTTISSRQELIDRLEAYKEKYEGQEVPRPPHWGGYIIQPISFEFWQGRSSRLHDRFKYNLSSENKWAIEQLSP